MKSSLRIIVTGLIAQHHTLGGVSWDYIQYVLGLHKIGHEVYYFEDSGEWPYNLDGGPSGNNWVAEDCTKNIAYLDSLFTHFGLGRCWAYHFPTKDQWYGLSDSKRAEVIQTADLLINVSGTLEHPEKYSAAKKRVYIDSDPGFTQIKLLEKNSVFERRVAAHDAFFSFGECLPTEFQQGLFPWRPTRTPIVIAEWDYQAKYRPVYSTIMSWTSYQPLIFKGQAYGQKDVEFARLIDLPRWVAPVEMEVAMSQTQHKSWQSQLEIPASTLYDSQKQADFDSPTAMLTHFGWRVVDPRTHCGDLKQYRNYIQQAKAEWSVAKEGYVRSQAGWFSCRSACYMAAGKPVVVQDTGFSTVIPTGEGILVFRNQEEAIAAIHEVEAHYPLHARAARELAITYFDSTKVLSDLIENAYSPYQPSEI